MSTVSSSGSPEEPPMSRAGTVMLVTTKFVYIHMPKTGGTFVRQVLNRLFRQDNGGIDELLLEGQKHARFSDIPNSHREKPVALSVRNPYDHYVSFYEYGWWKSYPDDTFDERKMRRLFPCYPEISFAQYLAAVHNWDLLNPRYVKPEIASLFVKSNLGPLTLDYIRFMFRDPYKAIRNLDYYTRIATAIEQLPLFKPLRTEHLNVDLFEFLIDMGFCRDGIEFILDLGKILPNGSKRCPTKAWQSYYTPELRHLVREKERFVFDLFFPYYDA